MQASSDSHRTASSPPLARWPSFRFVAKPPRIGMTGRAFQVRETWSSGSILITIHHLHVSRTRVRRGVIAEC
ncbi:protein of unknown function [Nocardia cyriacigeorgica GUH-2]|uniref:Uncharacterized protein n=1 Tax=Nocardia cyriacigeorgica (strain GUH-2) TaxID=1127134 RepID=H6RCS6_NOCCG|nr:protein of unknown function [Nocardia cyriacigeorgica GUH-2]